MKPLPGRLHNSGSTIDANGLFAALASIVNTSNAGISDVLGSKVDLRCDGTSREDSRASVIDDIQTNAATGINYGVTCLFTHTAGNWNQNAYIKASDVENGDGYGSNVSLSRDGSTLGVVAGGEDSRATGVVGLERDNGTTPSSVVYLCCLGADNVNQTSCLSKISNDDAVMEIMQNIALSRDGSSVVSGLNAEAGNATGVCVTGESACSEALADNTLPCSGGQVHRCGVYGRRACDRLHPNL